MPASAVLLSALLVAVWVPSTAALVVLLWQLRKTTPILPYEPRRPVPWSGIDVLMFIGILFLAEIVCLSIGTLMTGIQLPTNDTQLDSHQQSLKLAAQFVSSLMTFAIGAIAISSRVGASPTDLGWNSRRVSYDLKCGTMAFVMIVPIVFLVQLCLTKVIPYEHPVIDLIDQRPGGATLVILTVSTVVIAPLFEEFLFRVLLQGWLEKLEESLLAKLRKEPIGNEISTTSENDLMLPTETERSQSNLFGLTPGFLPITVSSLVFSLMHIGQGPAIFPLFIFAVVLGFLYRQTHRLLPSFTVHFLLNAVSMAMLLAQPAAPGA
jgi:membrane protease YdiL (CAAX protease family)